MHIGRMTVGRMTVGRMTDARLRRGDQSRYSVSMRCDPRSAIVAAALLALAVACDGGGGAPDDRTRVVRAPASMADRAPGRLLVLRLGDGVEVLRSRALDRAPRPSRGAFHHWKGRWEVRTARGRVLGTGRFRIPRRRHALFGDVGGPASAVDVALEHPVVWLRVPLAPGARSLVLYDDHGRRRLGEVTL